MEKYLFLIAAIILEVAGTLMSPLTDSFSKLIPTIVLSIFIWGRFTFYPLRYKCFHYRLFIRHGVVSAFC